MVPKTKKYAKVIIQQMREADNARYVTDEERRARMGSPRNSKKVACLQIALRVLNKPGYPFAAFAENMRKVAE